MMGARSVNRRHFRLSMLSFEAEAAVQAEPVPPVLPVLYLDDVMCAVMKPEKLLVHRTEIANGDTVFAVQCVREQLGRRVWPVHRLDRGTSGVLVFACDADTASRLGRIMMA
ncbi:MAG: pseudouridine synthase, partial [Sutterella wadsworthensis]